MGKEPQKVDFLSRGNAAVTVFTPENPLFRLEQGTQTTGHGPIYNRSPAFGADEIIHAEPFSLEGLELLIEMMGKRMTDLKTNAQRHNDIEGFYGYTLFDLENGKLVGRLFAAKRLAPTVASEVKAFQEYTELHTFRCKLCDIERDNFNEKGSRVVLLTRHNSAYVPYRPEDDLHVTVQPYRHVMDLTELQDTELQDFSWTTYWSVQRIRRVAAQQHRYIPLVVAGFHFAPLAKLVSRKADNNQPKTYHFHAELKPSLIPMYGYPFEIPFALWEVVSYRPKWTAYMLTQSNHQP